MKETKQCWQYFNHKIFKSFMKDFIAIALLALLAVPSCSKENPVPSTPGVYMEGLRLNELSSADGGWLELCNTTDKAMDISGLTVTLSDNYYVGKRIYTAPAKTAVEAGAYLLLSRANKELEADIKTADALLEVSLTAADGTVLDAFVRSSDVSGSKSPIEGGSYSRLPDKTGMWHISKTATQGETNFGIANHNAIWMWSMHAMAANMADLAAKGIGHIILNEQFFKSYTTEQAMARIAEIEATGMVAHVWFQCFYNDGTWISPVDDVNKRYKQELFDSIIDRAEGYLRQGIKGIHLDYIRYGGTAPLHNYPEVGVTAEGSITEFCRQLSDALRAINKHVILSAALMAERSGLTYYGQNPADMGQYIDILMPMIYRYSEPADGGGDKGELWARQMADYFVERSGKAEVWAGTTTYNYVGQTATGLTQERMRSDCEVFLSSGATGVVLFRYGLGNICSLNGLWE
jgi:hypothetical protein